MNSPETRFTLIGRLQDHDDEQAWNEFVQLYQPMIFRIARHRGLQHADAAEVAQEVLGRVAGAVAGWDANPDKGSFRGWLYRITRNLTIDHLRRGKRQPVPLDHENGSLDAMADARDDQADEFELEYRRSLFRLVAARIRDEFRDRTWQAFWNSAVEGQPVGSVAEKLDMSVGAVYIARSRVMRRLSAEIGRRENDSVTW